MAKWLGSIAVAAFLVTTAAAAPSPTPVKASSRNETTPAAGGAYFSWAKSRRRHPRVYDVFVQQQGQPAFRVNAPNSWGLGGGIDGTRLVYQQVERGNSNVVFFDLVSRRRSAAPAGVNTSRWEWGPSISGDWLLYARGAPYSPSLQVVRLRNLVTGYERVLDSIRNRRAILLPGDVTGNFAVWMKCVPVPRTCNVFRHDITAAKTAQLPNGGQSQYGPSVTSTGTMYFGRSRRGCGSSVKLVRATLDGKVQVLYSFPSTHDFFTTSVLELPPATVRIYFERLTCRSARTDIYRIDDTP